MKKIKRRTKKDTAKEENSYLIDLIIRYSFILLLSVNSMIILSKIFTPLTFYPVLSILDIFYNTVGNFSGALIAVSNNSEWHSILIAEACVATSAYFLLLILNLTTKGIFWKKRIKLFIIGAFSFLSLNILRIIILAAMVVSGSALFDTAHFLFWHVLSTIIVIAIWLFSIKIYKINAIPIVSDIIRLKEIIKGR